MAPLTFGSLFAGIGGFDLGFERAGMRCEWQVEIDPFCRRVLAKHWPEVARFEDVRNVGKHNLSAVDVICGGFPCQDISHAGRRAGLAGERSGLWSEYVRIIGELRPAFVVVENVTALLGRGFGTVLGDLAEVGYDAEWDCLPASAFSAPHRRDRVWIVAYPSRELRHRRRDTGATGRIESSDRGEDVAYTNGSRLEGRISEGVSERAAEWPTRPSGAYVSDADDQGQPGRTFDAGARASLSQFVGCHEWWRTEPDVGRVAHGVPARMDRLRGLGNAIVPAIAEWIGRRLMECQ